MNEGSRSAGARGTLIASMAVGAALAITACGDDGAEPTDPPTAASTESTPEATQQAPTPTATPTAQPQATATGQTYAVESGDTISSIAKRFDTTVDAIVDANDLEDPDVIAVGQELVIPTGP